MSPLETFIVAAIGGVFGSLAAVTCWSAIERGIYIATREWMLRRIVRAATRQQGEGGGQG